MNRLYPTSESIDESHIVAHNEFIAYLKAMNERQLERFRATL